jgi:hypothetical protein
MKLILLIFFFSSLDGISQDTTFIYLHDAGMLCKCSKCVAANRIDTLPSTILLTHKPPSFGHGIDGYCIYQGGTCTGKHLRYWRKRWIRIGPEYDVWGCKRRDAK